MAPAGANIGGIVNSKNDVLRESESTAPKYLGVHDALLELIKGLPNGAALPTERELCETFQVSRSTVRQALARLEHEQRIYRQQGKGTFVARAKIEQRLELMSHTEGMRARGIFPSSRLIDVRRLPAGVEVASKLDLDANAEVLRIERLRFADQEPIAIEVLFLNANRFDGIAAALGDSGSLYQLLSTNYGIELASAEETIEAVAAERREADLLHCSPGTPLLMLSRRSLDTNGQPTEYVQSLYRGDRFRFQTGLARPRDVVSTIATSDQPTVRVARITDSGELARVFVEAWLGSYRGIVDDAVLDALKVDETAQWLENLIGASGTTTVLAESSSNDVLGFVRFGDDHDDPRNGHIYSLYVAQRASGKGIGRLLLGRAIDALLSSGDRPVTLWVFDGNGPAQRLYRSFGFSPDGSMRVDERYGAKEIRMRRPANASLGADEPSGVGADESLPFASSAPDDE